MGITVDGEIPHLEADGFEVWPDNWDTLMIFLRLGTQWNTGGKGGATGLNYPSIPVVFDLCGVKKSERAVLFEDVQLMERAALAVLSKKK